MTLLADVVVTTRLSLDAASLASAKEAKSAAADSLAIFEMCMNASCRLKRKIDYRSSRIDRG
jgi:hypothetical protein